MNRESPKLGSVGFVGRLKSDEPIPAKHVSAELRERYAARAEQGTSADLSVLLDDVVDENMQGATDFGRPTGDEEL